MGEVGGLHFQCVILGEILLGTLDRVREELLAEGSLGQYGEASQDTGRRQVVEYLITLYYKHRVLTAQGQVIEVKEEPEEAEWLTEAVNSTRKSRKRGVDTAATSLELDSSQEPKSKLRKNSPESKKKTQRESDPTEDQSTSFTADGLSFEVKLSDTFPDNSHESDNDADDTAPFDDDDDSMDNDDIASDNNDDSDKDVDYDPLTSKSTRTKAKVGVKKQTPSKSSAKTNKSSPDKNNSGVDEDLLAVKQELIGVSEDQGEEKSKRSHISDKDSKALKAEIRREKNKEKCQRYREKRKNDPHFLAKEKLRTSLYLMQLTGEKRAHSNDMARKSMMYNLAINEEESSNQTGKIGAENKHNNKDSIAAGSVTPKINKDNEYECHICLKTYKMKGSWKRHQRYHTGDLFKCDACSMEFSEHWRLRQHIATEHHGKKFNCLFCDNSYSTKLGLTRHLPNHTGGFKYTCEICHKGFSYPHQFKEHMDRHDNLKRHKCPKCDLSFWSLRDIKFHTEICGKSENVECKICDKVFKHKKYLASHMKCHLSPQKFQCSKCGQAYNHRSSLCKHEKKHHL